MAALTNIGSFSWNVASTTSRTITPTVTDDILVIMVTGACNNGSARKVSGVTVDGVAMNLQEELSPDEDVVFASIWTLPVTAGTKTVIVTFNATVNSTSGAIYAAMLSGGVETPLDVFEDADTASNTSIDAEIDYGTNGCVLYGVVFNDVIDDPTWSSATELYDRKLTYARMGGAYTNGTSSETPHTETADGWDASTKTAIIAASWGEGAVDYELVADGIEIEVGIDDATLESTSSIEYALVADAIEIVISMFAVENLPRNLRDFIRRFRPYGPAREANDVIRDGRAKREFLRKI
jgi:hypothetical protein